MIERSQAEKQRFQQDMQPHWEEIRTMLAADRPPEWEGYRFAARIESEALPEKFTIHCEFGDRVSNRKRGGVPRAILDKLANLRMAYLDFSPSSVWRAVVIEQIWIPESKGWSYKIRWEY